MSSWEEDLDSMTKEANNPDTYKKNEDPPEYHDWKAGSKEHPEKFRIIKVLGVRIFQGGYSKGEPYFWGDVEYAGDNEFGPKREHFNVPGKLKTLLLTQLDNDINNLVGKELRVVNMGMQTFKDENGKTVRFYDIYPKVIKE